MNKRAIVSVTVAIMLVTFATAPPANAIVPALAWAVWGIASGITAAAVVANEANDNDDPAQAQASNQGQDVNDLYMNQLPHPIEYYQLGTPTPAGYVHGVEAADSPCVKC